MNMDNKSILKYLGISILKDLPITSDVEVIGILNGFFIYPYRNYWVVNGKMPLKYANELYELKDLGIRVAGLSSESEPIKHCNSDKLQAYIDEQLSIIDIVGLNQFVINVEEKQKKLMMDNIDDFYVEKYHIDKLEGLNRIIQTIKEKNIHTIY